MDGFVFFSSSLLLVRLAGSLLTCGWLMIGVLMETALYLASNPGSCFRSDSFLLQEHG